MPTGGTSLRFDEHVMRLDLPSDSHTEYYDNWFQPIMYAISTLSSVELEAKGKALAIIFKDVDTFDDAGQILRRFCRSYGEGKTRSDKGIYQHITGSLSIAENNVSIIVFYLLLVSQLYCLSAQH